MPYYVKLRINNKMDAGLQVPFTTELDYWSHLRFFSHFFLAPDNTNLAADLKIELGIRFHMKLVHTIKV
jgi:hypothetical protein